MMNITVHNHKTTHPKLLHSYCYLSLEDKLVLKAEKVKILRTSQKASSSTVPVQSTKTHVISQLIQQSRIS